MFFPTILAVFCFAIVATSGQEETLEEDPLEEVICSEEETMRSSVIECLNLMPSSHLGIIKMCTTQLADIGNDYSRLLDFYCNNREVIQSSDECIIEKYQERRESAFAPVKPVVDCIKVLVAN